jgi:hypothetical protein
VIERQHPRVSGCRDSVQILRAWQVTLVGISVSYVYELGLARPLNATVHRLLIITRKQSISQMETAIIS